MRVLIGVIVALAVGAGLGAAGYRQYAGQGEWRCDPAEGAGGAAVAAKQDGPRFVDNGDGTATDRWTGLMWEAKVDGSNCRRCVHDNYTWSKDGSLNADGTAFIDFLEKMNRRCDGDESKPCNQGKDCMGIGRGGCGHAGFTDWRLPTYEELKGLLMQPHPCATDPCIDPSFPGPTDSSGYWSSSLAARDNRVAKGVVFSNGFAGIASKNGSRSRVRAVRGEARCP